MTELKQAIVTAAMAEEWGSFAAEQIGGAACA